jgi:hypothetical protein
MVVLDDAASASISAMQSSPEQEVVEKLKGFVAALGSDASLEETGFALAGAVKCLKARSLVTHGVLDALEAGVNNKKNNRLREAVCVTVDCLSTVLQSVFEPYASKLLPSIYFKMGDKVKEVQVAAENAFKTIMANMSPHGIYVVLPLLGEGLTDRDAQWQSKVQALEAIHRAIFKAKVQVSRCTAQIVPSVIEALTDTKQEVQVAAKTTLTAIGKELINSPEMVAMVDNLVAAIINPIENNTPCVEKLMDVTFMNPIDRPCLSIMVPVLKKALQEKRVEYKRRALLVVGNICGLVINSKELIAYSTHLLPDLELCVRDSNPEMRGYGATAMTAFLRGMAPDHMQEKLSTLQDEIVKLQQGMVSDDETTKTKSEQRLKDLIESCSGDATKQHQTEEEIAADLERLRLEAEKKQKEDLEEWKQAEEKRQKAENVELCDMSEVAKREAAAAEHAIKMAEEKKQKEIDDKKAAKAEAEAEKIRQMKKFQEQQAKAMLKHKQAKKKK